MEQQKEQVSRHMAQQKVINKDERKVKSSHKKRKQKLNLKRVFLLLGVIAIVIIVIITIMGNKKEIEKENLSVIIDNEDITSKLNNEIIFKNDVIYMSLEDLKSTIDQDLYQEEDKIILSSDKKIGVLELDKNTLSVNGSNKNLRGKAFKDDNKNIYLPLSELEDVYNMSFSYIEKYKNIVIDFYDKKMEKAYASKDVNINTEQSAFSDVVEKIKKGNWVVYVSEENGWAKVRTQNGNLGYMSKGDLTNFVVEREDWKEDQTEPKVFYKMYITRENISDYSHRLKVIENTIKEVVKDELKAVKFIYEKAVNEDYKKFKVEATAIVKEAGLAVLFEEGE